MTYRGAIVDLDGTVYRGSKLLPGAGAGVEALRRAGIDVLFVTNNPVVSPDAVARKLGDLGLDVAPEEVLTSGDLTREYLQESHPDADVFLVGSDGLRAQLAERRLTDDPEAADVVVGSVDPEFTYDALADAQRALRDPGTAFVGTDPDGAIPATGDELVPGSGAMLAAIGAASERDPDVVVGKPSAHVAEVASRRLGADPGSCLLVGDRLDTDIAMGAQAGLTTVLVLTGVTSAAEAAASEFRPDHVVESLGAVDSVIGGD